MLVVFQMIGFSYSFMAYEHGHFRVILFIGIAMNFIGDSSVYVFNQVHKHV